MQLEIGDLKRNGRFSALLADGESGRADHDRPLLQTPDWVVAPTLGAVIPNWLLAIPRETALSFREWRSVTGRSPPCVVEEIISHLHLSGDEVIWFEHGPRAKGTVVGCGADYAHLHLLIRPSFSFSDFLNEAITRSGLDWQVLNSDSGYSRLGEDSSYLIAGSGDRVAFAEDVDRVGSQFFRKIVASLVGLPETWDYRVHSHAGNIRETVRDFHARRDAGARGL